MLQPVACWYFCLSLARAWSVEESQGVFLHHSAWYLETSFLCPWLKEKFHYLLLDWKDQRLLRAEFIPRNQTSLEKGPVNSSSTTIPCPSHPVWGLALYQAPCSVLYMELIMQTSPMPHGTSTLITPVSISQVRLIAGN